jgi:hypothetical protein
MEMDVLGPPGPLRTVSMICKSASDPAFHQGDKAHMHHPVFEGYITPQDLGTSPTFNRDVGPSTIV